MAPPHLPVVATASVSGGSIIGVVASSVGSPSRPLSTYSIGTSAAGKRSSVLMNSGEDVVQRLADDVGGEWEREGFGKSMEERLEEVGVGKA